MPAWLIPALTGLFGALGGASQGAAEGRQRETQNNAVQDSQQTTQYSVNQNAVMEALKAAEAGNMSRAQLDLLQRAFALDAPTTRMNQSVQGSHLANAQDLTVSHPRATIPEVVGGRRPSNFTPETRALGAAVTRQTLMDQMQGDNFSPVPQQDWQGGVLTPPGVTPQPQAGALEKWGGIAGVIGSGLPGIQQAIDKYTASKQPPPGAWTGALPWKTPPTFTE